MHVSESLHYPADPQRVAAMLADPRFVAAKFTPFLPAGTPPPQVGVERDGEAFTVRTSVPVPAGLVPDAARALVPADLTLDTTETWAPAGDGSWRGTLTATLGTLPATVDLDQALRPVDGGTERTAEGEVSVRIPFLGAKLEAAAAGYLDDMAAAEHRAGLDYLAS